LARQGVSALTACSTRAMAIVVAELDARDQAFVARFAAFIAQCLTLDHATTSFAIVSPPHPDDD